MTSKRVAPVASAVGVVVVIAVGVAVWLYTREPKAGVANQNLPPAPATAAAKTAAKAPAASGPVAKIPAATAAAVAPAAEVSVAERRSIPKQKRVQDRAVPLAKLPQEIYQSARPSVAGGSAATTRRVFVFGPDGAPLVAPAAGPKVGDALSAARERLAKDAGLREWFDQWQVDVAAERATSPARVAELRALLEKTTLGAEDLRAVSDAVAKAEGENSDAARAWRSAAVKGR